MRIGIIGAGNIGGNVARQAARSGHSLMLSFARDQARLQARADELGASVGTPAEAAGFGEIVVIAVPWSVLPEVLKQAGSLRDKIVIDTTNQFGSGPMPAKNQTAAAFNQARMPGARYTKSFNTLTSAFQEATATRTANERVVQWICGDDEEAKGIPLLTAADREIGGGATDRRLGLLAYAARRSGTTLAG